MLTDEDENAFLHRRAAEERLKMAATSCMVKAVHEEMVEIYEERLDEAASVTADLEALAARIE